MFELTEKLKRLDIPSSKVIRLYRSLGDLQLALPGQKSQMAIAYVCAFSAGKGARVAVGLFMKDDCKVIYYLNGDGEISNDSASMILNEAVNFCESLGFMMNNEEIHKMDAEAKNALWDSTPLKNPPSKPKPVAPPAAGKPAATEKVEEVTEAEELSAAESIEIDLGLPRRMLATSLKKDPPTPAELEKKRERLRENLGRFLSSL